MLNEAAPGRSRPVDPHDLSCTFISSYWKEMILQYFVRTDQHDERLPRAFCPAV